jgi:hypothetical protein
VAISGHQVPSGAIRCHQVPSGAIRCHQVPSDVIRCHQGPSSSPPMLGLAATPKGAPPPIRRTGTLGTDVETLIAKSDVKIVAGLRLPARLNGFRAFVGDVSLRISLTSCTKRFMSDSSVTAEKPLSNPGLAAASRARSVVART